MCVIKCRQQLLAWWHPWVVKLVCEMPSMIPDIIHSFSVIARTKEKGRTMHIFCIQCELVIKILNEILIASHLSREQLFLVKPHIINLILKLYYMRVEVQHNHYTSKIRFNEGVFKQKYQHLKSLLYQNFPLYFLIQAPVTLTSPGDSDSQPQVRVF